MTYLIKSLEELLVLDITAFADQLHSVVEARNLMLDLKLEAFAEYPVVMNLAAVAIVKVVTESVTSFAAVAAVVAVAVIAALEFVTNQMHPDVIVAAPEPWTVVICVLNADQFAYLSYQTGFQETVVAAAVTQEHYFESPTVADEYQRGCFAEPLTVVAAACFEDYSAGQAASVAAAACPQHCFVVQLFDFVEYLQHLTVVPSAAAAAVEVALAAAAMTAAAA